MHVCMRHFLFFVFEILLTRVTSAKVMQVLDMESNTLPRKESYLAVTVSNSTRTY